MRALVVEDDSGTRRFLETVLSERGHQVVSFANAEEAWQSCTRESYQLALIDWFLGDGMDGLELCQRMRDLPWGSQVVVLIVSVRSKTDDLETIIDAGADDYVTKPVTPQRLHIRLAVAEQRLQNRFAHLLTAEELRRERNFITAVLDTCSALVMVLDRRGRIIRFNRECERLSGFRAAEVHGKVPNRLLAADGHGARLAVFHQRLLKGEEPGELESWLQARDGPRHLIRWTGTTLRNGREEVEFVISTGIDITRREELECRIIQAKREWEQTFDTVPELVILVDADHCINRVNQAMASLLGRQPRELIGKTWFRELHGSSTPPEGCIATALREHCELTGEATFERTGRNYLLSVTPLPDPGSGEWRAVIVARDLTEHERAEEVARRQAMIAQIEEIFSAFRHEAGNTINTLRTTLDVLRANYTSFSHDKRMEYLERCDHTVQVAERLLTTIRHYQQYDRLELETLSLSGFLSEQRPVLMDLARQQGVACAVRTPRRELKVRASRTALFQVLVNLVRNALAATSGHSRSRVVVSGCSVRGHHLITVSDNGTGIPAEDLSRVMTPFFSTQPEGSGLGLAIVHKLMTQMAGEVAIQSQLGRGTKVELRFPSCE